MSATFQTRAVEYVAFCRADRTNVRFGSKADIGRGIRANKDVRAVMVLSDSASGPLKDCRQQ